MRIINLVVVILTFSSLSFAASNVNWVKLLEGQWQGHFVGCMIVEGPGAIKEFDTDVKLQLKTQGEGLQGLFDLGAHGWAYSSFFEKLPNDKGTYRMTLRKDAEEWRLDGDPNDDFIWLMTAMNGNQRSLQVQIFTYGEDDKKLGVTIKDSDVKTYRNITCEGDLVKK